MFFFVFVLLKYFNNFILNKMSKKIMYIDRFIIFAIFLVSNVLKIISFYPPLIFIMNFYKKNKQTIKKYMVYGKVS